MVNMRIPRGIYRRARAPRLSPLHASPLHNHYYIRYAGRYLWSCICRRKRSRAEHPRCQHCSPPRPYITVTSHTSQGAEGRREAGGGRHAISRARRRAAGRPRRQSLRRRWGTRAQSSRAPAKLGKWSSAHDEFKKMGEMRRRLATRIIRLFFSANFLGACGWTVPKTPTATPLLLSNISAHLPFRKEG